MIETLVFETTYNMSTGDPNGIVDELYYTAGTSELLFAGPGDPFEGNYPDAVKIRVFDDHEFQLLRVSEDKFPPEIPGMLAGYTESGSIESIDIAVPGALLSIAPSAIGDQSIEFFVSGLKFEDYPADATDIPIALYAVIDNDPMKKLSRNYNDKDAIKVKNPIADALDRLTDVIQISGGSGGGGSAKDYVKLTLESDVLGASNSTLEALYSEFFPEGCLVEAIPVHFAEGYLYMEEHDYSQKTIIIDPLDMLIRGENIECYVDRNVLFMLHTISYFLEGVTYSSDDAPSGNLIGVYVKIEITGATVDSEIYFDPAVHGPSDSIDFSTAEDEVTIRMVVIDPDDSNIN